MKITYNTTGFFNDSSYNDGLKSFLYQYDGRFPEVEFLHLDLEETDADQNKITLEEQLYYSSNGNMLKIHIAKWAMKKPSPLEIYSELREIFDKAVEEHLKSHQHYLRYAPQL